MDLNNYYIQKQNGEKNNLINKNKAITKEQLDNKYKPIFEKFDDNKNGELEEKELCNIMLKVSKYEQNNNNSNDNNSIFQGDPTIKQSDFIEFVQSIKEAYTANITNYDIDLPDETYETTPDEFIKTLGINTNTKDGKIILEKLNDLPEEGLKRINSADVKEILEYNELEANFENVSNILEIVYNVHLRTDEEEAENASKKEDLLFQIKVANFLANFYDSIADLYDSYTEEMQTFELASEGIGYVLNKIGLQGYNKFQFSTFCREASANSALLKSLNPEKFKEGFKGIYGEKADEWGISYDKDAFKKLFNILENNKAFDKDQKMTQEYKDAILKALNFNVSNPFDDTATIFAAQFGEALLMLETLAIAPEMQGGKIFAKSLITYFCKKGAQIASKKVNNKLLQGILKYSGNAVKLAGPALNTGKALGGYALVTGTGGNIANRAIKSNTETNTAQNFINQENNVAKQTLETFAFGVFAGAFGASVTQRVMNNTAIYADNLKVFLDTKFANGSAKLIDVLKAMAEKTPNLTGFLTDITGFTAFETALNKAKTFLADNPNATAEQLTDELSNEFKHQGYTLAQFRVISHLIMWMYGSKNARITSEKFLNENLLDLNKFPITKNNTGYSINLGNGKKVECKNEVEMISTIHLVAKDKLSNGGNVINSLSKDKVQKTAPPKQKAAQEATPIDIERIQNMDLKIFAPIDNNSVRGNWLLSDKYDLNELKKAGIKTIIDFSNPEETRANHPLYEEKCKAAGIERFSMPIQLSSPMFRKNGRVEQKDVENLKKFFDLMNRGNNYVHCRLGLHRTDLGLTINYLLNPKEANPPLLAHKFVENEKDKINTDSYIIAVKNLYNNLSPEMKQNLCVSEEVLNQRIEKLKEVNAAEDATSPTNLKNFNNTLVEMGLTGQAYSLEDGRHLIEIESGIGKYDYYEFDANNNLINLETNLSKSDFANKFADYVNAKTGNCGSTSGTLFAGIPILDKIPSGSDLENAKELREKFIPRQKVDKNDLNEYETAIWKTFKIPLEKLNSKDDFTILCQDKFDEITKKEYPGRRSTTQEARAEILKQWEEYLRTDDGVYTDAMKLLVMHSITKDLKENTDNLPPEFNAGALADTFQKLGDKLKDNKYLSFNFKNEYESALLAIKLTDDDVIKGAENFTGWKIIPSRENDPEHFEENVKLLQTLSYKGWCTKSTKAQPYLSLGDFHVYIENGRPQVGLRLVNGLVHEIEGQNNDGNIPIKYLKKINSHMSEQNLSGDYRVEGQIRNAKFRIEKIAQYKAQIANLRKPEDILNELGYNVISKDENGLLTIDNFETTIDKNLGINLSEIVDVEFLLKHIKKVEGAIDLGTAKVRSLGAVEYAMFIEASNSPLEDLGNLKNCVSINIKNSKVKSLGNLETADNIEAKNSSLEDLGKLKECYYISLNGTKVKTLNNLEKADTLEANETELEDLGQLKEVGILSIINTNVRTLGNLQSAKLILANNSKLDDVSNCKIKQFIRIENTPLSLKLKKNTLKF